MHKQNNLKNEALNSERKAALEQLEDWLETPMLMLGFAWLTLLIVELVRGLTPLLESIGVVIWIIFILEFTLKFTLAPDRFAYLRRNWLTAIALLLPALRVFRVARVLRVMRASRAVRGLRLVRVVSSLNRGMRALGASMGRRGLGYVAALTLAGAAGMYTFESTLPDGRGLNDYASALWWTAMIMTTLGSEYWPQTGEGRVLCILLAFYAFAVFGYITAALASFFVGRDAESQEGELAGSQSVEALRSEIMSLRQDIHTLLRQAES